MVLHSPIKHNLNLIPSFNYLFNQIQSQDSQMLIGSLKTNLSPNLITNQKNWNHSPPDLFLDFSFFYMVPSTGHLNVKTSQPEVQQNLKFMPQMNVSSTFNISQIFFKNSQFMISSPSQSLSTMITEHALTGPKPKLLKGSVTSPLGKMLSVNKFNKNLLKSPISLASLTHQISSPKKIKINITSSF